MQTALGAPHRAPGAIGSRMEELRAEARATTRPTAERMAALEAELELSARGRPACRFSTTSTCATATACCSRRRRARGHVLPDGRVGVHGRAQEGSGQALLHAAVPVPHAQVRAASSWSSSATPTTPRKSTRTPSSTIPRSGGTVVLSALELMQQDRARRAIPASSWNIYAAQASDGDAFGADARQERALSARNRMLPLTRYFAYIEMPGRAATRARAPVGRVRR